MIDIQTALEIARREIARDPPSNGDTFVIMQDHTLERDFGWVFFYQTRRYLETGDIAHVIPGNAPLLVDRADGSTHYTGAARPVQFYIEEYQRRRAGKDIAS